MRHTASEKSDGASGAALFHAALVFEGGDEVGATGEIAQAVLAGNVGEVARGEVGKAGGVVQFTDGWLADGEVVAMALQ